MEAMQDVWEKGYYDLKDSATGLKNSLCSKNYIISMTDGFPSADYDNKRITVGGTTVTFADWDGDGWTMDPTQSTDADYYDDVANWMYKKSWRTFNTNVADAATSYENVTSHHISFGAKHPLLGDAAYGKSTDTLPKGSGGLYIAVNNKAQMISAFYSLGLAMSESISFTAPVVSVDANNKIQNGDDLYMGLFLPENSTYWVGNVKKFKLGEGENRFKIYGNDASNAEVVAMNANGEFQNSVDDFWDTDDDSNGAADIKDDGVGELLLEDVTGFFTAGATTPSAYWNRPIYTYKPGTGMVKFDRNNITTTDLGVADNATRDKLINFTHGYTYDANATTGAPLAVREWILGPIIHSRPVVVEYYNTADPKLPLLKRLVVVGSNDGMLHVFDDTTGDELFAFIPSDILPKLQTIQATTGLTDTVDGLITLYRRDKNPKYLLFGERRGGGAFWNLDISNQNPLLWTVKWNYTNAEISQSWSEVKVAILLVGIDTNGVRTYKDIAIITGGYDSEEDYYPEPFTDTNSNGKMDTGEWSAATQDKNGNTLYDKYNPSINEKGRGIFVVDIDNPATTTNFMIINPLNPTGPLVPQQVLPFSVTYGAADDLTGVTQKRQNMKFSFPASPAVVTGTDKYSYYNTVTSSQDQVVKGGVFQALYAVDVYANLFKTKFSFNLENANPNGTIPYWEASSAAWSVNKVFAANPGSVSRSGRIGEGSATGTVEDQGRKAFYPPTVSWGGTKGKFEAGNYSFPNTTFSTRDTMASLFFGTGDRENPKYTMIRNRFYGIYDDSSVSAQLNTTPLAATPTYTNIPVTSATYYEDDLLNVTCDELGKYSTINSCYLGTLLPDGTTCTNADVDMKKYLNALLRDDAVYGTTPALEYGAAHENDAKGWYITLEDQGNSTKCSHVTYFTTPNSSTTSSHDNHVGEQVLSQAILYYGYLYFTSYQPSTSDPCNPQGNGLTYALDYLDGSAAFDLNPDLNDVNYVEKKDITDRYNKYYGIVGIASGFSIINRDGHAAAWASVGSSLKGPGRDGDPEIPTPGLGMELFYWRDTQ
jgi:type IV pilus assembly protein PilY1